MDDDTLPRLVRVPLAGYIDVLIDSQIEVKIHSGWGEPTEFETAACDAASTVMGDFFDAARQAKVKDPTEFEWMIEAYPKITSGNMLHAECNEVEDMGCE